MKRYAFPLMFLWVALSCGGSKYISGIYVNTSETHILSMFRDSSFVYVINEEFGKSITMGKWERLGDLVIIQSDSSYLFGVILLRELRKDINGIKFVFLDQNGRSWCCPRITFDDSFVLDVDPSGVLILDSLTFNHFEIFSMTIPPYTYYRKQYDSNYFEVHVREMDFEHFFTVDTLQIGKNKLYDPDGLFKLNKLK